MSLQIGSVNQIGASPYQNKGANSFGHQDYSQQQTYSPRRTSKGEQLAKTAARGFVWGVMMDGIIQVGMGLFNRGKVPKGAVKPKLKLDPKRMGAWGAIFAVIDLASKAMYSRS